MWDAEAPQVERRARIFRDRCRRVPTLALVSVDQPAPHDEVGRSWLTLKRRVLSGVGLGVSEHLMSHDTGTDAVIATLTNLSVSTTVDGVFLQYPLPEQVNAEACAAAIALAKDVDGARFLLDGRQAHAQTALPPATSRACVALLATLDSEAGDRRVTVVVGEGPVGAGIVWLAERQRLEVVAVDVDSPELEGCVREAQCLVAATGRSGSVDGRWLQQGAVVVDCGYHHDTPQGDITLEPGQVDRLHAYVPPRGGLGPLTVLELAWATLSHAESTCVR